ncbi:MAG: hypothetical protein QHH15_06470 [Candidatus Thermoplasmatota archaeon]|nr:hypothetical protein [Candidatus Thermoplasmatota archaeon]
MTFDNMKINKRWSNLKTTILFVVLLFVIFIQKSFGQYPYNDILSDPPKQTEILIYTDHHSKYISDKIIKQQNWIPIRFLFASYVDIINWDDIKKIAFVNNHGKSLVFNFSKYAIKLKDDQILVPKKHSKLINGRTYIDSLWLGWIFDMYATKGKDKERDLLRKELSFLDIKEIDLIITVPKDNCIHMSIYFNPTSANEK